MSFETTAAEVVDGLDLTGRRAVVTGGASGIGIPTARALAGAGAEVTLAVRRPDAAAQLAEEIGAHVRPLDLADLTSVEAFTREWTKELPKMRRLILLWKEVARPVPRCPP